MPHCLCGLLPIGEANSPFGKYNIHVSSLCDVFFMTESCLIDECLIVQETMSNEHAMRFPFVGSAMLLSLFLLFKFLSKDLVNAVLTCYFFVLGIIALS